MSLLKSEILIRLNINCTTFWPLTVVVLPAYNSWHFTFIIWKLLLFDNAKTYYQYRELH